MGTPDENEPPADTQKIVMREGGLLQPQPDDSLEPIGHVNMVRLQQQKDAAALQVGLLEKSGWEIHPIPVPSTVNIGDESGKQWLLIGKTSVGPVAHAVVIDMSAGPIPDDQGGGYPYRTVEVSAFQKHNPHMNLFTPKEIESGSKSAVESAKPRQAIWKLLGRKS